MAKVLYGPTVIGVRGTVAGITFSANRAGPYARGWHTPPNPRSANQLSARSTLATWAASWRNLTAAQQTTWNVYAAAAAQTLTDSLGQPYFASGFNWWVTTQINLQHIGAASILTAPILARQAVPVTPSLEFRTTASAGGQRIRFQAADPNLALNHAAWVVVINSLGLNIEPAILYYMTTAIPNVGRYVVFTTPLAAKFGTFVVGQRAFAWTYSISAEGQASPTAHLQRDCFA